MYQPLDPTRKEIRLVQLEKGAVDDTIQCTLRVASLAENITYEALSYVWGDSNLRNSITIDGYAVDVTVNLKLALQHLRRTNRPRVVWVDAICINQADSAERTHQVGMMGDVCRKCTNVIAWLGEESADSQLAFDGIEEMGAAQELHWDTTLEPALNSRFLLENCVQGIAIFLDRPWWHRTWTVQESILPPSFTFLCGTRELPSETLFTASQHYHKHSTSCCYGMVTSVGGTVQKLLNKSFAMVVMLDSYRQDLVGLNILEMISLYRERQCTDPRDKVYGLIGLANGVHAQLIEPDYTKSAAQIYEEFTAALLERSGGLQVLSLILPPTTQQLDLSETPASLPSWVPGWTDKGSHTNFRDLHIRMERLTEYCASRDMSNSPISGQYQGSGHLAVRIHRIGKISKLGEARDSGEGPSHNETFMSWRRMAQVDIHPNRMYTLPPTTAADGMVGDRKSLKYADAYWLTLCASVSRSIPTFEAVRIRDPETHRMIHDAWWKWTSVYNTDMMKVAEICQEYRISLNQIGNFINDVSVSTGMRRLFCADGEMSLLGLAPRNACVGDTIVVIEGGLVPFIIREEDREGHAARGWKLVADAYVHGFMDGEALGYGREEDIILV